MIIEILANQLVVNRIISNNDDVNWPPKSCDLTLLDYYICGTVKDKLYANNPQTITELKAEIEAVLPEKRYDQQ